MTIGKELAIVFLCAGFAACADMTESQKTTATGAGIGATAGALIGAMTAGGHTGRSAATGALIGGALGAAGGYAWNQNMEKQKQALAQDSRGTGVTVTQTADNRLKLDVPSDAGFAIGKAEIKPALRAALDRYAVTLNQHTVTRIQIVGHTDSTGSDAINNPLSQTRADATRDYLVARGVAASRISSEGRGSREPVASNDTEAGRAANRRVEIYVFEPVR
jgi:outer membrane protein OmpA-like peptidoglycan-associated protein